MIDIGYKNYIDERRIQKILNANSTHAAWLRKEALSGNMLIDCTQGRKTNTIIIMGSGHLILSSLKGSAILRRMSGIMTDDSQINNDSEKHNLQKDIIKALEKMERAAIKNG